MSTIKFTLLTSYQKSLIELVDLIKSYELREGSTAIEVKSRKFRPYLEIRILP
jgi:hypothetical protein